MTRTGLPVRVLAILFVAWLAAGSFALGQGAIGPITFAAGERDVEPVDPTSVFGEGAPVVYAFFAFTDLSGADRLTGIWYRDGAEMLQEAYVVREVLGLEGEISEGKMFLAIEFDGGATPGSYLLEVQLNGQLARAATFSVVAAPEDAAGPIFDRPGVTDGAAAAGFVADDDGASRGPLLVHDGFDDPRSGWGTLENDRARLVYGDGHFAAVVDVPSTPVYTTSGTTVGDALIEVDATPLAGPDDNAYGVVVRLQDSQNYYAFLISADGYYAALRREAGQNVWEQAWTQADAESGIGLGRRTNRLRVLLDGAMLRFYVNGRLLVTIPDAVWREGQAGLFAASFDQPGVAIGFDDWRVWGLDGDAPP